VSLSRRAFIKILGHSFYLPHLSAAAPWFLLPHQAHAQAQQRTHFLGVYFPNGAYMPVQNGIGSNGDWNWSNSGGLYKLVEDGHQQNTMLIRNIRNGHRGRDPHWQNTAGFLSGQRIVLDPSRPRAGWTIDQIIAQAKNTFYKSLQIGPSYFHVHPAASHVNYSSQYINKISYDQSGSPIPSLTDPAQIFSRLFGANNVGGAEAIAHIRAKKKSFLDFSLSQSNSLKSRLSSENKQNLEVFEQSLREVELQLDKQKSTCDSSSIDASGDYSNIQNTFIERNQLLNRIIALAFQCNVTNVATIMYAPAISSRFEYGRYLNAATNHHGAAHHGGNNGRIENMRRITRMYTQLYSHLLDQLKSVNTFNQTLVLYGSDMSDGNVHNTRNIPVLLSGNGSDLKFGQEVRQAEVPMTSLLLRILRLYGITNINQLGESETLSSTPLASILT